MCANIETVSIVGAIAIGEALVTKVIGILALEPRAAEMEAGETLAVGGDLVLETGEEIAVALIPWFVEARTLTDCAVKAEELERDEVVCVTVTVIVSSLAVPVNKDAKVLKVIVGP